MRDGGGGDVTSEQKEQGAPDERAGRAQHQLDITQAITHIGSWEWDLRTNVVTWSDELFRIYGFEPRSREITLEFFLSRLHDEDRARVNREVQEALAAGGRFAYPERVVRPDGSVRQLATIGEVTKSPAGDVTGLIGTCRDVTEERARDEQIQLYADIVKNVQIGLSVWEIEGPADIAHIRLVAFNPASEKATRMTLEGALGKSLYEIAPYAQGGELARLLVGVAEDGKVREAMVRRSRNPADPTRALALKAFPLAGRRVGVAIEDVTEQTVTRRLRVSEQLVFEMIASGASLETILSTLVLAIEEHSPPTIGSILLLDATGTRVRHGAAPSLPEAFNWAIDGSPIGPTAGSCGTAAYVRRAVYVRDIELDPLWFDYRELAQKHGLRACWSTPIFATDGRVLGTFALYYREPRDASEADRTLIARATHIAGIAIERRELEDQLRALSAHVESVREDERTGIAREIHDQLGQAMTALKMDLAWISRRTAADGLTKDALLEKLRTTSAMIDEVIGQIRRISAALRPGVLDDLGLDAALEWQAEDFEKRTGLTCTVVSNVGDAHLDPELSTAIFRIFQEALTNIVRHANATVVDVRLEKRGALELFFEVKDDGKGISEDAARSPKALGLLGVRERVRRLGGTVIIAAATPRGTALTVSVPLRRHEGGSP
jgi:PAS domain S-box-containing protein